MCIRDSKMSLHNFSIAFPENFNATKILELTISRFNKI